MNEFFETIDPEETEVESIPNDSTYDDEDYDDDYYPDYDDDEDDDDF